MATLTRKRGTTIGRNLIVKIVQRNHAWVAISGGNVVAFDSTFSGLRATCVERGWIFA